MNALAAVFLLLTAPAFACSRSISAIPVEFQLGLGVLLALPFFFGKREQQVGFLALLAVLALSFAFWGSGGAPKLIACVLGGAALLAWSESSLRMRATRLAILTLLVGGVAACQSGYLTPLTYTSMCKDCMLKQRDLAWDVETYAKKHGGAYPPSLEQFGRPTTCRDVEVSDLARRLYKKQGITFEPYTYEVDKTEGFRISCPTCHQLWFGEPGYPATTREGFFQDAPVI